MNYRGRNATSIENAQLRVTVLREGGHIAEILHKGTGINPLWSPPWNSIELSTFTPDAAGAVDARLLAGIMGHNVCLDLFGVPSDEEAQAGIGVHGEAPVIPYKIEADGQRLKMATHLPLAQIRFERLIELRDSSVEIAETVTSLTGFDRPIGWTQHVTLGPPFLARGATRLQFPAVKSKTFETAFGADDFLLPNLEFDSTGHTFSAAEKSSGYTAHLMDPAQTQAFFRATHPDFHLELAYYWHRDDFPWLGIWEENHSRLHSPWNGETLACGMEFGVSPYPETRRQAIDRGSLFGTPTYRWLPAYGSLRVRYSAVLQTTLEIV